MDDYPNRSEDAPSTDNDFDELLTSGEALLAEQGRTEELKAHAGYVIMSALIRHGVPYALSPAGDDNPAFDHIARPRALALLGVHQDDADLVDEDLLANAVYAVRTAQAVDEYSLYTEVAMSIAKDIIQKERKVDTRDERHNAKRRLIARWIVQQGIEYDSEWVRFLNDAIPGAPIGVEEIGVAIDEYAELAAEEAERSIRQQAARHYAQSVSGLQEAVLQDPSIEISLFGLALSSPDINNPNFYDEVQKLSASLLLPPHSIVTYVKAYREYETSS